MSEKKDRAIWGSKLGFLLAAIGSAIGLGNIWRFSYMTYTNGGGAFLVPYFTALIIAGVPLIILEFTLGHREKGAAPLAFARISKKWEWVGWWMPTVASIGILLFYSIVIAWCLDYFFFSLKLSWGKETGAFFENTFLHSSGNPFDIGGFNWPILSASAVVWIITWAICYKEINHGIEKACLLFMPILMVLTIILVCWSLTLEGASEGIKHYLKPDWEKINIIKHPYNKAVWNVWLSAFGQIFFTLSLGFGIMIAYASYLPKNTDIVRNGLITAFVNCLYSFFAGFAVFGTLGFMALQKGVPIDKVVTEGAGLAFVVYPEAINQLPVGKQLFGAAFFLTLFVAGLSSAVSLVEAFACAITDKFSCNRKTTISIFCLFGFFASSIFTTRAGLSILDIVDHFINQYGLITGGLLECIFVGWILKAHIARNHVNSLGATHLSKLWDICIKYITPGILAIILAASFINEFKQPYGDGHYSQKALLVYGIGTLILTLIIASALSLQSWHRAKHFHKPDEDHLLT